MPELTYAARDAGEFKELCIWLKENGFTRSARVVAEKPTDETPEEVEPSKVWENKYKALSGDVRMRLKTEEVVLMENENLTREDIARLRVEKIELELASNQTPATVKTEEIGDVL